MGLCQLRFRWSVWTGAPDAWLEDLWVCDAARGAGVGRALIEAAAAEARGRGARRLELDVAEGNASALELYRSCGFTAKTQGDRDLLLTRPLR